jgi:hypothetical protein
MAALDSVFLKLLPIYFLIFLGFVAGKFIKLDKKTIGTYIVYLLSPAIVFNGTYRTHITPSILTFPILFYILCNSICLISWLLAKPIWADKTRNLLAFSAGFSNIGYFGLPTAMTLLGPQAEGPVALILLALQLFISTTGLFVAALGNLSPGKSLIKLLSMPYVYAFAAGLFFNYFQIELGAVYNDTINLFRGAYTVIGTSFMGIVISKNSDLSFDWKYITASLVSKYIFWPIASLGVVLLDMFWFKLYSLEIYKVMLLISIVPIGTNIIAFAADMNLEVEKTATAVLISTIISSFLVPVVGILIINYL